jgi:xanthine/uracil permease
VVVLIAENTGHIKAVGSMTGRNLDGSLGRGYMADGLSTMLAGAGGGSGTTTYAENIGVMAATRVYSTAAYIVAGLTAIALAMVPKFGALIVSIPIGVLGGATLVLYGLIAVLGGRIWVENKVDFKNPVNLFPAAIGLIMGAANLTWTRGDLSFNGIATGTFGCIIAYHLMNWIAKVGPTKGALYLPPLAESTTVDDFDTTAPHEPHTPASVPTVENPDVPGPGSPGEPPK